MQKAVPAIVMTGLLLCPLAAAQAQEQELKQTTDEVKVTATKVERPIEEVPYSVDQVRKRRNSPARERTIADTAGYTGGSGYRYGAMAGIKRISIRGETACTGTDPDRRAEDF
jgi:hypothetical protein